MKLLYITAEESLSELARRSQRLGIPEDILVLQSNSFEHINQVLINTKPNVVIIDSIQTIFSTQLTASPGSVAQVSFLATQFLVLSKTYNISIILVGHVTKEGQIAGPKTLEHLVDSVLLLESSESNSYRTLTFSKHRYGSTNQQLLLKMEETGLQIVTDPSLALLENLETGVGVCYGIAMDKNLPLVVEIQALISNVSGNSGFGRREVLGIKMSKLNTLLAIIEKYFDLELKNREVYLQISGLAKTLTDDSLDLPILLALLSSFFKVSVVQFLDLDKNKSNKNGELEKILDELKNNSGNLAATFDSLNSTHTALKNTEPKIPTKKKSTTDLTTSPKLAFAGRLTLSGNLRLATSDKERLDTAKKLGFSYNYKILPGQLNEVLKL